MTFLSIQDEVKALVIDLPDTVINRVPLFVNRAARDLQKLHNFRVMRAIHTADTTLANHTVGDIPTPNQWKAPRGRPWYVTQLGSRVFMEYLGDSDEEIAKAGYDPEDPVDKGRPERLFLRSTNDETLMSIEVYPFPDGLSDWTAAPVGEYRLVIPFWRYVPDLTDPGSNNWFTIHAEQYLIEQAAGHAFAGNQNENRATFHWQVARIHERIAKTADAQQAMAGRHVMVPRADVNGSREGPTNWRF